MHIYPHMRLGKTDQKIFGHSAIVNVVRILLLRESGKNREMNIEEVLTVTATRSEKAERQQSPDKRSKSSKWMKN